MPKSVSETVAKLLDTPETREKIWKVIVDAEASDDPKIVKQAKALTRQREAIDRQRGEAAPE